MSDAQTGVAQVAEVAERLRRNIAQVVVGKDAAVELLLVALLADGHVLIEDVPGIGKTTLAKSLAASLDARFSRIQFTPDLLPSDVTGIHFFNQKAQEFVFRPGPVSAHLLLADEINRATPRTQSALLEAMQERQVTIDGETMALPRPFLVVATQNPIELEGTFPLPEAQMDRFLLQVRMGYPTLAEEDELLTRYDQNAPLETLAPVTTVEDVLRMQTLVRRVHVHPDVRRYMLDVVRRTREHPSVALGASPRGSLALYRASQALAAIRRRDFVIPSDVRRLVEPVLTHRIHISPQTRLRGRTPEQIVAEIAEATPAPVVE